MLLGVQGGPSMRKCREPHRLGPSPASGLLFSAVIRLIKHILHSCVIKLCHTSAYCLMLYICQSPFAPSFPFILTASL